MTVYPYDFTTYMGISMIRVSTPGDALHFDYLSQRKNDSIDVAGLV